MIVEKEMFLGVDGRQAAMEMIECQMAVSSIEVMQQLERNVDRRMDGWMDGWMDGISVSGLYYVAQLTADTVKTLFHPYCGGLRLIL